MSASFFRLPLTHIVDETPDSYSLLFPNKYPEAFQYLPGQYLTVRFFREEEEIRRPYSLVSSPYEDEDLMITIKRIPGGVASNYLRDQLAPGDEVEFMPPLGTFTISPNPQRSHHYILIGGGSGVTPLMSILRSVLHIEPQSKVSLYLGNRNQTSIIFLPQLQDLQAQYGDRLVVFHALSQPEPDWKGHAGRLEEDTIYHLISELFMTDEYQKSYFLCGPTGLMEGAQNALEKLGVNPIDIHKEYFDAPVAVPEETVEEVEETVEFEPRRIRLKIDGKERHINVEASQTILDAAIDANLNPPYSCCAGTCITCQAMLHEGAIYMEETIGLSEEAIEAGYILTCQARPMSDDVYIEYEP